MLEEVGNTHIKGKTILIRKANPDMDEGVLFAEYLNEASEGFFKSILGKETYKIIAKAYVKPYNEYSYENAWFMECNNQVIGMVSGYTRSEKKCFKRNVLSQSSKGFKFRILMLSFIGRALSRFLGSTRNDDFYIQAIALNIQSRGKGLGQKLLEHITEKAIEKGCKTISLDVSSKNTKAIKSYNKFGMKVSSYWPNFLNIPPIFTRMEKRL